MTNGITRTHREPNAPVVYLDSSANRPPASSLPAGCIAARLTAAGRSAIATVGIVGRDAARRAAGCFQPAHGQQLDRCPSGRVVFGIWRHPDAFANRASHGATHDAPSDSLAAAEEVVVHRVSDTRVDVHCHGGHAAAARILADLASIGIETVDWLEWLAATEPDPVAVEARVALTKARTQRTAALLLDQYQGALRDAQVQILDALAREQLDVALERLDRLLARASCGLRLATPWQVVLTGRPNAGKSSLINALVGYRRAIVHEQPGTTRDVVAATTVLDGWPVELSDTAGLRETEDAIESAGVARARDKLETADLVILVHDASLAWSQVDQQLYESTRATLVAHNKCDLPLAPADNRPSGIHVSASTGAGVDTLAAVIVAQLVPQPPEPGDAVPFTKRQVECLERARGYVLDGSVSEALEAVRALAAHSSRDDCDTRRRT